LAFSINSLADFEISSLEIVKGLVIEPLAKILIWGILPLIF